MSTESSATAALGIGVSLPEGISSNYVQKSTIGNYYYTLLAYAKDKECDFLFKQPLQTTLFEVKTALTGKHSKIDDLMIINMFHGQYDEEDAQADAIDAYEKSCQSKVKTEDYNLLQDPLHPSYRRERETNYAINLRDEALKSFRKRAMTQHRNRNLADSIAKVSTEYDKEERRVNQLHANMLVAMKSSISESIRSSYEDIGCCKSLLDTLVTNLRAKVISEVHTTKECFDQIKIGNNETIPALQNRLFKAKREYEFAAQGDTITEIQLFQRLLLALPRREFEFFHMNYGTLNSAQTKSDRDRAIDNMCVVRDQWLAANPPTTTTLANNTSLHQAPRTRLSFKNDIWCPVHGYGGHTPEQCNVLQKNHKASPYPKAIWEAKHGKKADELQRTVLFKERRLQQTKPAVAASAGPDLNEFMKIFANSLSATRTAQAQAPPENSQDSMTKAFTDAIQGLANSANKAGPNYLSLFDSAATPFHMHPFVDVSNNEYQPDVQLADGSTTISNGLGTVNTEVMELRDTLHVPGLAHGLISIPYLVRKENKKVIFGANGDSLEIVDKTTAETIQIPFNEKMGLWTTTSDSNVMAAFSNIKQPQTEPVNGIWHKRFMFANADYLQAMLSRNLVRGLPENIKFDRGACTCVGCMAGKSHQQPWPNHQNLERVHLQPGEKWEIDAWGPSPIKTIAGNKYLFTYTDTKSRYSVGYLLKKRSDHSKVFRQHVAWSNRQTGNHVKALHFDLAGEFLDHEISEFTAAEGITVTYAPARTKEANALAENRNRVITQKGLAALHDAKLPPSYWGDSFLSAIYVNNRTACKSNHNWRTPFQEFYKFQPTIDHLRRFGCLAFVFVHLEKRKNKLDVKSFPCTFIGYAQNMKAYRFVDIYTGQIFESRHAVFLEDSTAYNLRHDADPPVTLHQDTMNFDEFIKLYISKDPEDQDKSTPTTTIQNRYQSLHDESAIDNNHNQEHENIEPHINITDLIIPSPASDELPVDPFQDWDVPALNSYPASPLPTKVSQPPALPDNSLHPVMKRHGGWEYIEEVGPLDGSRVLGSKDILGGPSKAKRTSVPPVASSVFPSLVPYIIESQFQMLYPDIVPLAADISTVQVEDYDEMEVDLPEQLSPYSFTPLDTPYVLDGEVVVEETIPSNTKMAMISPNKQKWLNAMKAELRAHEINNTFEEAKSKLKHCVAFQLRWVYALKRENGKIIRFKARLVMRGYRQQKGIHYNLTSSPVLKVESFRLLLLLACLYQLKIETLDVDTAYLNSMMKELLYAQLPEGFTPLDDATKFLVIKKSLYGAKQAGRNWYMLLTKFLKHLGYTQLQSDPCVFFKRALTGHLMLIGIYVDDLLLVGSSVLLEDFKNSFSKRFHVKMKCTPTEFLNYEFHLHSSRQKILITQHQYMLSIFKTFATILEPVRPSSIPAFPTQDLSTRFLPPPDYEEQRFIDNFPYRPLVGCLLHLTNSRPEIMAALGPLCQYLGKHRQIHCLALLKIFGYLKGCDLSIPHGIVLGNLMTDPQPISSLTIDSFTDSDWGKDLDTRRSRYGAILYVNDCPIRISSGLQDVIHQATSHAELDAANSGGRDIIFVRQWLDEIGIPFTPPTLHSDNTGAIDIAENDTLAKSSRHLDIKLFWLRDQVTKGFLQMTHCTTKDMIADILTKPLPRTQFEKLRPLLGVSSLTKFADLHSNRPCSEGG